MKNNLIMIMAITSMPLLFSNPATQQTYPFSLPPLAYAYESLEPYIDTITMRIHHDKHHQAYVENLNAALKNSPDLQSKSLMWLLKNLDAIADSATRTAIQNNAGGHWNHSFFWMIMKPKSSGLPVGSLAHAINKTFGSFDIFKEKFTTESKKVFGSGWAWLCRDTKGALVIVSTKNQDSPISQNLTPIIGLDVWEHAYYLKYQNKRPDYITNWWHVINWNEAERNFKSK